MRSIDSALSYQNDHSVDQIKSDCYAIRQNTLEDTNDCNYMEIKKQMQRREGKCIRLYTISHVMHLQIRYPLKQSGNIDFVKSPNKSTYVTTIPIRISADKQRKRLQWHNSVLETKGWNQI